LESFALPCETLVELLNFRDEALHLLEIGPCLSVKLHFYLSRDSLYLTDGDTVRLFLAFLLEFGELAWLGDFQEALHVFIVFEFRDAYEVVEEVLEDSHSFFHMSLCALCSLLLRNGRNDLGWVFTVKVAS
jgi:hypothetical protein